MLAVLAMAVAVSMQVIASIVIVMGAFEIDGVPTYSAAYAGEVMEHPWSVVILLGSAQAGFAAVVIAAVSWRRNADWKRQCGLVSAKIGIAGHVGSRSVDSA